MHYQFGLFVLDVDQRRLFRGDEEVRLQPKAFDVLRCLIDARPRALSKEDILSAVWPGTFISENSLATVVRDLRTALGDDAHEPHFIRTAYGYGYSFVGQATAGADQGAGRAPSAWSLVHNHREIELREGDNILGRTGHDVVILDSPTVSRHHAVIRVAGAEATVSDLGSKNGTWVGTTPVSVDAPLTSGAEVRLGSVVVTARYAASTPTTETVTSGL